MTRSDLMPFRYGHPVSYFKTAFALRLLRDDILGPERFDPAFRKFIGDWAYRHPQPSDFFRTMESEGGEDLSWFWREWFFDNAALDLSVDGVEYVDGDAAKGARITISNRQAMVAPATLRITFASGKSSDIRIPVETWMQSGHHVIAVDSAEPIQSAVIDPDHRLPDADRSNNGWMAH